MSSKNSKLKLTESWVVEDDDYSPDTSPAENETQVVAAKPSKPKRPTRGGSRGFTSPEPELVMPSLEIDSMDGSWAESPNRIRHRNRQLPSERMQESRRSARASGTLHGSPEKRNRPKTLTPNITKANPTPSRQASQAVLQRERAYDVPSFLDMSLDHGAKMLSWLFDVLFGAVRILKTPISYLLAVWLLFGLGLMARNLVTNSVYASLTPICRIPGSSLLNLPFCPTAGKHVEPQPPVEFDQLMTVQSNFEQVLEESAGGASLPLDMKRGEASIRDLRQLVRYSHLQSKDELVLEFDGFIETARIASYDLQKFNSHVGRAVDNVISTTRWTSRVLDGIQEQHVTRGAISGFINDKLIAPFQPAKFTEKILLDQYIIHTRSVEDEIFRLIEEAQAMLMILTNLEDRLDVIHGISTREDGYAKAAKEEILSSLWAMVGGHRSKLNKMDRQLNLLQQVGTYRKKAYAHVSGTVLRLQAMGASLEDLRDRVASPELLRDRADIPLSVHIENIQRGVERLEDQRQHVRRIENDHIRETLDRGKLEGTTIDG